VIHKKCLSAFASYLTQPTVTVGQVVTERIVYLLLSGELDNGQCDVAS
jgi:hypothetical protein